MDTRWKIVAAVAGVLVVAGGAYFLIGKKSPSSIPVVGQLFEEPICPLTGAEEKDEAVLGRPAVAIKVENNPAAYPLSGLDEADVIYEEVVEGGLTRFMVIYHCGSTEKAGPVRSARAVDPAIMSPITRILGAAGGNDHVRGVLEDSEIVIIDEPAALSSGAMERVDRPGVASEHTLYANAEGIRKLGKKEFSDPPSNDLFQFGDLQEGAKPASEITISFSASNVARFEWKEGAYYRFQGEDPLLAENGDQLSADNVLIEQHTINNSEVGDVLGNLSPEIADVTGTGKAWLFRDGKVLKGTWTREGEDDPVSFKTKSGEEMALRVGRTWVELAPNSKGEVKGSVSFSK